MHRNEEMELLVEMQTRPRNCVTVYPSAIRCERLPSEYIYPDAQAALNILKRTTGDSRLRLVNATPSMGGPCPGVGTHYGVKSGGAYIASISCCPCCRDTLGEPVMTTLCRII